MQIEEGYRMNAEADNFFPVSDPDCVPLENSVLYILTSKPDLSCRNFTKVPVLLIVLAALVGNGMLFFSELP